MSGKAMGWALEQETEQPIDKLILIALGNFADEVHQCFPSRRKLAQLAMCSLDTVDRAIRRLIEAGLVAKDTRLSPKGGLSSNVYTLPVGDYTNGPPKQQGEPSRILRPPIETHPGRNLQEGVAALCGGGQPQIAGEGSRIVRERVAAIVRLQKEPTTEPNTEPSNTPLPPKGGNGDPVELYKALVAKTPKLQSRGERLSTDWQLPKSWREWARVNCFADDAAITGQASIFRDYWIAKPGAQAAKLDWEATWRNWCRKAFSPAGSHRGVAKPATTGRFGHVAQAGVMNPVVADPAAVKALIDDAVRRSTV
jgi:hypothetical protein